VPRDDRQGRALQAGDELRLGDADRPSALVVLELSLLPAETAREVTVVAHRAILGEVELPGEELLGKLLSLLAELRSEQDLLSLTRRVLQFLVQALPGASRAECFLKDATGRLVPTLSSGKGTERAVPAPLPAMLAERLQTTRQAILVEDTEKFPEASRSIRGLASRSLLLAPLVCEGEVLGALQIGAREGGRFGERELDLAAVLAQQLSGVLAGARLIERLKQAEARLQGECDYLREKVAQPPALQEMIGQSPALNELKKQIQAVAPSRTTVLISGDTGAGKELVARAIHEQSPRGKAVFAAINCSALARGVLESELFGHVRGAFTGAHRDRQGLFEVANQGTLFLDEIGDLPLDLQPKLLRALEEGAIQPVGSTKPRRVDVRVVAATHRDLEAEVAAGRFRQDLLYRLNVFSLRVPALRERSEDIPRLAALFLERFSREQDRPHPGFTAEAATLLQTYPWPGNVRELKNEMERASLLAPTGEPIGRPHLSERLGGGDVMGQAQAGTLAETMERLETLVVREALRRHDGNRTQCAKALGISRQALIAKIARLGLSGGPDGA
jgi:Nif-specific regulatory protein